MQMIKMQFNDNSKKVNTDTETTAKQKDKTAKLQNYNPKPNKYQNIFVKPSIFNSYPILIFLMIKHNVLFSFFIEIGESKLV